MKKIKISFIALLLLLTALWLFTDTLLPEPFTYFSFRGVFVQYSGVIAIALMSVAMLLALRPKWLEPYLDGLDKMYRLHKWLGISVLIVSTLHWWWANGTKWMVGWGWLVRPARSAGGGPSGGEAALGSIQGWLGSQKSLTEGIGLWMFYACAILLILALIKRFPYHLFTKTHKWLAACYLALVYHSVVLTKFSYWSAPIGWLLAVLMIGGSIAAILVLFGRVGSNRKVKGRIDSIDYHAEMRVLETTITLQEGWSGHQSGQFAFVTSDKKEGAHPYTIASAWNPATKKIVFITKALGDHTSRLHNKLRVNMPVVIEGPYGRFTFASDKPRQIWIGAGIGITPFIARMRELTTIQGEKNIDLFHPTTILEPVVKDKLLADTQEAGVRLHLLIDQTDGLLDGERIRAAVPDWKAASIWFCGPPAFGQALRNDFVKQGLSPKDFHQELFELR
ncbi:MAG: ferric reductase [Chlorobiales bacterium]|jgi:predicted ferric reductase|nr:ferric reductase [Chlorobiales bacterium]